MPHEIKMIVAVDENWGIGYDNELLFHLKEDMKQFREKTTGNVVIMGRRTLESLPGGRPLPNRKNIVLSHDKEKRWSWQKEITQEEFQLVSTVDEVWRLLKDEEKEVFVIGGEQIYNLFFPFATKIYVTKIQGLKKADAYFMDLDALSQWEMEKESENMQEGDVIFSFMCYNKKH